MSQFWLTKWTLLVTSSETCLKQGNWAGFAYLCAGWRAAAGSPCGRQPWGPAHRSADWACSAGAALSAAALCMRSADALGTGEQPRCAQTQEPDTCTCYQPDSNDTPPPAERTRDSLRNFIFIWFTFRIMQYLLLLIYNYIQHILLHLFMHLLWNVFFFKSEEQLFKTNSHCRQWLVK